MSGARWSSGLVRLVDSQAGPTALAQRSEANFSQLPDVAERTGPEVLSHSPTNNTLHYLRPLF